jgi:putative oxidoreductase
MMDRNRLGWTALRVLLAGLIAAHGWSRLLTGGYAPFGEWLTSQGIPAGPAVAIAITAFEIIGTPLLLLNRWVFPLTLAYAALYAVGIVMVHAKAGWFVVGAGRNGMEYSVLLIATLLCVGWQHAPRGGR